MSRFVLKMTVLAVLASGAFVTSAQLQTAQAAGGGAEIQKQHWHFSGPFGTYDKAALQRGYKVYRNVCSACHSMDRVRFRNLEGLGYDEGQIKNIASEYTVTDGPDSEGDMFERSALPSDPFVSPYPNQNAATAANNGAYPPDLSLINFARAGNADYIYALLTGYVEAPHDFPKLSEGKYYNAAMSGHIIAMAPPLSDDSVMYEDGTNQTVSQYSKDVAEFLQWTSDPYMEDRKRMGVKVVLFLLAFAGVMYAYKKKIWSHLH
jgi:ubiquinol-cytochrome c reductase cytochrome c1 subunit